MKPTKTRTPVIPNMTPEVTAVTFTKFNSGQQVVIRETILCWRDRSDPDARYSRVGGADTMCGVHPVTARGMVTTGDTYNHGTTYCVTALRDAASGLFTTQYGHLWRTEEEFAEFALKQITEQLTAVARKRGAK